MLRTITGHLLSPNGTPIASAPVKFQLTPGSYTPDYQYLSTTVVATTDEAGYFSVELWVNEEGERSSQYRCSLPDGTRIAFVLNAGTEPIDLSLLRQAGITKNDPQYKTILSYINSLPGGTESGALSKSYVAGENVSALKIVYLAPDGRVYVANNTDIAQCRAVVGMTILAAAMGAYTTVLEQGLGFDSSWNWRSETPLFLGSNGMIVQTLPPPGNYLVVGQSISPTQIYVRIEDLIELE